MSIGIRKSLLTSNGTRSILPLIMVTKMRKGRKPKGGSKTPIRLPDDLRAFLNGVQIEERRDSLSNTAVALLYEAKAARERAAKERGAA